VTTLSSKAFGLVLVLGFCLVSSVARVASADDDQNPPTRNYMYEIRIPQTAQTCEVEAANLATRISQVLSVTATGVCHGTVDMPADGGTQKLYSLLVTYSSDKLLPLGYTALLGGSDNDTDPTPSNLIGAYPTWAACLADMPAQKANFETNTGLVAVAVTCEPGNFADEQVSYVLQIDGFGKPAQTLYTHTVKFEGTPDAALLQQLNDIIVGLGAKIVQTNATAIFYYAPNSIQLEQESLALFDDEASCTAQTSEAQLIFKSLGADDVVIRCLPSSTGDNKPVIYWLEVVHVGGAIANGDFGYNSVKYYSFAECMADRDFVVKKNVDAGMPVVGGICHQDDSNQTFVLELYSSDL
jgi:hypothetical protein